MPTNRRDYVLSELDADLSAAVDYLYNRALRSIKTNGRVRCPTPAEAEAYLETAMLAAARRLGIPDDC